MSLRKSPRLTRALLAANRRNSRKSTGPRTAAGKRHSAWNAVRHGRRARASCRCIPLATRNLKTFLDFYFQLHDAIIPAESLVGVQAVLDKALEAWNVKRCLDRWIDTRTEEDWLKLAAGAARPPSFWRLRLRRPGMSAPGWTVTISVWLRWGRGPGDPGSAGVPPALCTVDPALTEAVAGRRDGGAPLQGRLRAPLQQRRHTPRMHAPKMHVMVSVHSTGPRDVARASSPCESRPELALSKAKGWPCHDDWRRTKPESNGMQMGSQNMSVPPDWDPDYLAAYALAERFVGWLMSWGKRTKPEYYRNQEAYKNMSPAGESGRRSPNGSDGVRAVGRVLRGIKTALVPRKECSQLELFQTKPECKGKEGPYKNMSKTLGWLATARRFLIAAASEGRAKLMIAYRHHSEPA